MHCQGQLAVKLTDFFLNSDFLRLEEVHIFVELARHFGFMRGIGSLRADVCGVAAEFLQLALHVEDVVLRVGHFGLELADGIEQLEMGVLLRYEFVHNLIGRQLGSDRAGERILNSLQRRLRLSNGFLGDGSLLRVELVELLHSHLLLSVLVGLLCGSLECLNLLDGLVTVLIDLVYRLDHAVQVAPLHTQVFLKLQVDLFENYSFAAQLVDLVSDQFVLSHGIAVSFVGLIESVFNYLRLLAQLRGPVLVGTCGAAHRCTLLSLLFDDLTLQVFDFFIDALARAHLSLNLLNQVLNFQLLSICSLLSYVLLLYLPRNLHLLHLELFEQLVVLNLKLAHFFVLLAELRL